VSLPIRRPKPNEAAFAVSVIISHPSVAPFVQQAARAIEEAGQLDRFITTVRDNPASVLQKTLCRVGRLAGRDMGAQFRKRAITDVPISKVESHPYGELLRLATGSIDRDGRLTDFVWQRTENAFDRLVARALSSSLTGVYGFEYCSRYTFEAAHSLGLKVAYDVPAPEPRFVQQILDKEIARFPELSTHYHRYTTKLEDERIAHRHAEWRSADVVIAASTFTKRSFAAAGLDVAKVQIVPYGAPVVDAGGQDFSKKTPNEPLTMIWAGTFGIRKGAHYLLEAWRSGEFGKRAQLKVFGSVALPDRVPCPVRH